MAKKNWSGAGTIDNWYSSAYFPLKDEAEDSISMGLILNEWPQFLLAVRILIHIRNCPDCNTSILHSSHFNFQNFNKK